MGVFDQAARFATRAEPTSVVARLSASHPLVFRGWLDTRSIPFPGGPDRTADLVAALDDSADSPVLLIQEFQSQHDPDKLDVTLEEAAILRSRWKRQLEGFEMTESQVVNEWISQGEAQGELKASRQKLLEAITLRFPGCAPADVIRLINQQESIPMLDD